MGGATGVLFCKWAGIIISFKKQAAYEFTHSLVLGMEFPAEWSVAPADDNWYIATVHDYDGRTLTGHYYEKELINYKQRAAFTIP